MKSPSFESDTLECSFTLKIYRKNNIYLTCNLTEGKMSTGLVADSTAAKAFTSTIGQAIRAEANI
jgi:hypothetical protein